MLLTNNSSVGRRHVGVQRVGRERSGRGRGGGRGRVRGRVRGLAVEGVVAARAAVQQLAHRGLLHTQTLFETRSIH